MSDRFREWRTDWYESRRYADDQWVHDCCSTTRDDNEHLAGCVYGLGPSPRGSHMEGDRVDHEQDSVGMFDRAFLPSGDLVGDHHRELPLEGPDWDAGLATRRLP